MPDYGKTAIGALNTDVNWCRGHPLPANALAAGETVLKSVSIYVGTTHTSQIRVGLYQGGAVGDADTAVLIRDFGLTTGSATSAWLTLDAADETLDPDEPLWILVKGNDTGFSVVYDADTPGDFYATAGRSLFTATQGDDETVAYTTPLDTADSTADFWYSFYLTAEAPLSREQEGFRFRNDDGSESGATGRQSQDVADTVAKETALRLRMLTDMTGNPGAEGARLVVKRDDEDDTQWRTV